jgi:hypothetical protein
VSSAPSLNARQIMLVNLMTDIAPAMAIAVQPPPDSTPESLLSGGPSKALGQELTRDILWRAVLTSSGASVSWLLARLVSRRGASTVGLLSLVGSQLAQTLATGKRTRAVTLASLGSAALLLAVVETPGVSQLFGCRPVGPLGLGIAGGTSVLTGILSRVRPERIPVLEAFLEEKMQASGEPDGAPAVEETEISASAGTKREPRPRATRSRAEGQAPSGADRAEGNEATP